MNFLDLSFSELSEHISMMAKPVLVRRLEIAVMVLASIHEAPELDWREEIDFALDRILDTPEPPPHHAAQIWKVN